MGQYQDLIERIKRELAIDTLLPAEAQGKRCMRCPLPGHDDHDPSFTIYRETNSWICWSHPGGRSAGSVLDYLMAERGVDFKEAVRIAAEILGIELRPPTEDEKAEAAIRHQREDVLTALARVAHSSLMGESSEAAAARAYLEGRGLGGSLLKDHLLGLVDIERLFQVRARHPLLAAFSEADFAAAGLRASTGALLFRGARLCFPLRSRQRVTGMTFRALDPADKRKYVHLAGQPAGLFNEDALLDASRQVVLTEGIPDALQLAAWDILAVGNLGVEASKHASRFQRLRRVTLVWDNDAAGRGRVLTSARAIQAVMTDGDVRLLHVPGAKDINDWAQTGGTAEDFTRLCDGAPDLIEYQTLQLPDVKAGGRMGREEQTALQEILESLALLPELRQAAYLDLLKKRCGIHMGSLRTSLKEIKARHEVLERTQQQSDRKEAAAAPLYIFEDPVPYVAALSFNLSGIPTANIGIWMEVSDNGVRVPTQCVVESHITKDGVVAALVPYADRRVNDPKSTRFPNPGLPLLSLLI